MRVVLALVLATGLALPSVAFGADTVLSADPDLAAATARAARILGTEDLAVKRLSEVLPTGTALVRTGPAHADPCAGAPTTMANVKTALNAAESSVSYV